MSAKQKKRLARVIAAAVLFAVAQLVPTAGVWRLLAFLVPYAVIGWDVLWRAVRNIVHGQVLDEHFLMSIATIGAFAVGEYAEACFVMLFYQVGELFQSIAVGKSRGQIASLMEIRPDVAHIEKENGEWEDVDPEDVPAGSVILIRPGERVPLDGCVIEGDSWLDTAALTGESVPRRVAAGDAVISGCINQSGVLRVRTNRAFGESTVSRILEMVENCSARKSRSEAFITRFARIYTPAVVGCAVALSVIPPIFLGNFSTWFHRALTFLVVSCPCALVISVPLSFFGGIGGAARIGVLFKGSGYLEALADCAMAVFDKTGTLTRGVFRVTKALPSAGFDADGLLETAALAECYSPHPIARSLREAYGREIDGGAVGDVTDVAGQGVRATLDGRKVAVGNARLMQSEGVEIPEIRSIGTVVFVAVDGVYVGAIEISDEIKEESEKALAALRASGVRRTVMLTGDRADAAEAVAETLGIDEVSADCLPEDKVARVEALLDECHRRPGARLAFIGDGVNDAPVLVRADVGIAMGALGSDAAIEAADVVLMDDDLGKVATAIRISRKTRRIVRQNIVFALAVKILAMVLGAFGITSLWMAVFADVGVAVIAILNAMRTLRIK